MLKAHTGAGWEFDTFKLMPEKRLLLSDGAPVPLMSKAFDTLVLLIENRDRVVTKDELLRAVWPDVVVEEGNLTQQIFLLRKALGESAQQPRFIVTVPGHGYRFTAPVREIAPSSPSNADRPAARRRIHAGLLLAGILAVAGLVLVVNWTTRSSRRPWLDPATVRIAKVTETGLATTAAISRDGRYVAYTENAGDEHSLYVQQLGTGGRTRVVGPQRQALLYLTFSPDGQFLYFARGALHRGGFILHRIPAIGGQETPILDDVDSAVSFSPDGRHFVFMRGAGRETHIVVAEAGGGAQRILAMRRAPFAFSFAAPAWSPDGKLVAAPAVDRANEGRSSIVLLSLEGGDSRELYATAGRIGGLRWLPDGSGLLTVISETVTRQMAGWQTGTFARFSGGPIWRIAYPGGAAERVTSDLADYDLCCADVGANGTVIAGVVNSLVSDLWIAPADQLNAARQITWGTPVLSRHSWLPDNNTIVFRDVSGRLNAVAKDGRTFSLPIPDGHKVAGGVSACGDGRYVVFQAVPGNSIWRVTPNAGGATRLTSGHVDSNPACSPDGKWLVYSSFGQDVASTWRIPIAGGEPAPLVPGESFDAFPSPSGRLIYYSAFEWEEYPVRLRHLRWIIISADDRKRLFTLDRPDDATGSIMPGWAPDESGLDYVVTRNGVSNIWRQPLTGGPSTQITQFSVGKIFSFAWSPDAKWLTVASGVNRSDVVTISR